MADTRYKHIAWHGVWLDEWTAQRATAALLRLPAGLRARVRAAQGSWSGAAASAGTHTGAAALDIYLTSGTAAEWRQVVRAFRDEMFAMWERPYVAGLWPHHIHGILIGHPYAAPGAKAQVASYKRGRNGLKGDGVDPYGYRPDKITTAPYGKPVTITVMGANMPAPGVGIGKDLGNDTARIKAAVPLIRRSKAHVVGWNELGPIKSAGHASVFAHNVDHYLGPLFGLVRPTKSFNENYVSYRRDVLEQIEQYEDSILEAPLGSGNKHLTRVVFRHKKSGRVFAVGVFHLPPGSKSSVGLDRQQMGKDAFDSMAAVSAKHDNCPFVIIGDTNSAASLHGLQAGGMKRARDYADKSDGPMATFTHYNQDAPSKNRDAEFDSTYWSKSWYVLTWHIVRKLLNGNYVKPRPSDHDFTVSSARI